MNKIMSDLQGKTFSVFQREIQEMQNEVNRYFHFDSKLWRAIQDHIWHEAQDNALVDWPEGFLVVVHRGTGAAISHQGCFLPSADYSVHPPKPTEIYVLNFNVTFVSEEDRHMDRPPEKRKSYSLTVPIALEESFTKGGFDAWIAKKREEKEAEAVKDAAWKLCKMRKHPLWKKIQKAATAMKEE